MDKSDFAKWKKLKEKGDPGATRLLGKLVQDNEPLAKKYAARVCRTYGNEVQMDEDIEQAARIGMIIAFETYDPTIASFSTWSWHKVRYEIQKYVQKALPYVRPKSAKLPKAAFLLAQKIKHVYGREPTPEELGVSEELWLAAHDSTWIDSIDRELAGTKESPAPSEVATLHDRIPSPNGTAEDAYREKVARDVVNKYRDELKGIEGKLFDAVFLSKEPLGEVASRLKMKSSVAKSWLDKWEREIRALVLGWEEN
jgi:RNA polymerase sigma factor (sigma-70 family)